MKILITGATGLVGRRLVDDRLRRGDAITALSRSASKARERLPEAVEIVEGDPTAPGEWQRAVDGQDAIVHLAGAGVADKRWTPSYKRLLFTSRVDSAHQLVEAVRTAAEPPTVFVGASAVGWYADAGDAVIDESTERNAGDFFGDLCGAWEGAAAPARELGVRTVHLRIGLVLDPGGGLVGQLAPIFRLFLGGPIGLGRAWMPWVHWADVVGLVDHALRTPGLDTSMNATAPNPVRNAELSRALGAALGRPSLAPVPPPMLRVVLGELGRYANASQRVVPRVARETGYAFHHEDVHEAMRSLFAPDAGAPDPAEGPQPPSSLARGPGRPVVDPDGGPRPRRPIRLVAVPLEHGLLDHGRMPAGAVAACRAAAAAGTRVVIATGRPPRGTRAAVEAAGTGATVIACNGALIWDHAVGGPVHHEPLDAGTARAVVAAVREADPECLVGLERLDRWYTDRPPGEDGAGPAPDETGPLERFLDEPLTQVDVLTRADGTAAVRTALDRLLGEGRIARFERPGGLFQVTSPRADKGIALQRIARADGLERAEVMAVGGGLHDAGMVEWAGFSAALGDAPAPVRRLATVVVPDRDDGGLARALARYVVSAAGPAAEAAEAAAAGGAADDEDDASAEP